MTRSAMAFGTAGWHCLSHPRRAHRCHLTAAPTGFGDYRMTLRVRRLLLAASSSLATGVLVMSASATTAAGTAWTASGGSGTLQSVIVQARPGQAGAVVAAVRAAGGHVDRALPIINGF